LEGLLEAWVEESVRFAPSQPIPNLDLAMPRF